jgi:signal transduction histidine kinase
MTSTDHPSSFDPSATDGLRLAGPGAALVALALWCAVPTPWLLAAAAAGVAAAVVARPRGSLGAGAATLLILAILAGFHAHRQAAELRSGWAAYWADREEAVGRRLAVELEELLQRGEEAVEGLAGMVQGPEARPSLESLSELRRSRGAAALALYDAEGDLRIWDGVHRGRVPEEVQRGAERYAYRERPLFGYLYVTAPAGGGTAAAAYLLRTNLPDRLASEADDFATRFRDRVGEEVRLFPVPLAPGQGGWELEADGEVLVSVVLEPPDAGARIEARLLRWRGIVFGLLLGAWLLLALASPPGAGRAVTVGAVVLLAAVAPVPGTAPGVGLLFGTGAAPLPGSVELSLGRLLALSVACVATGAVVARPRLRLPPWVGGSVAAIAATALLAWLAEGVRPVGFARGEAVWVAYQAASVLLLTLTLAAATALVREHPGAWGRVGVALGLAVALGAGAGAWVWLAAGVPWWWPALWAVPAGLAASGAGGWREWSRPVASWMVAGVLAASLGIPMAWSHRVEARIDAGEERLRRLARESDPELEEDLAAMAREARVLDARGVDGVDLLYGALRASGFAGAGHPVWLTLWSPAAVPREELRVGVGATRPVAAEEAVMLPPDSLPRILAYGRDDARYVLRVPLLGGWSMTAAAPPFADRNRRASSPLLAGGGSYASDSLTLVPREGGVVDPSPDVAWERTAEGWRARGTVSFPGVTYDARYIVPLPGALLGVARATLLLVLDTVLLLLAWAGGRALLGRPPPRPLRLGGFVISFRARVTLALFGFFLLANAIFGTLAYRTIAGASNRAAQVLAARVADDAAGWYFEERGAMELLGRRVGAELLEYRGGALREGSVEELVELGLYEAWVPYDIHRRLASGESLRGFRESALGRWGYVTAYRRLPDGDLLGAPVPLQAGATALGSNDVLQLLLFAVLLGGALSLALALLVGRALTRPLQSLQVASERVGAGNLEIRLPDRQADEFGSVFRAFNRMVERLRHARRQLVRTTRRTQAIMEEAAVGIVALDPSGEVTLVNPRAENLLGTGVELGRPLPPVGRVGSELREWLEGWPGGGGDEAGLELHVEDRRIRVRARRLDAPGSPGGVVLALEDVTDELRTERVLAWGEMARQVAHEVKNPLTPMKLGIQHIRRAWDDQKPGFDGILERNADAVLREIDRLAAIAQSFSRFGAPAEARGAPLVPVELPGVVREVMALYGASEGPVRFRRELPPDLPTVRGRVMETKEVLVNLLENAREALRETGGTVVVSGEALPDGRVALHVEDDGAGIPDELMARVFEPHFSTRSGGTGLGLAIVRRLVESWGGSVALRSEAGVGTRVTVTLPPWGNEG